MITRTRPRQAWTIALVATLLSVVVTLAAASAWPEHATQLLDAAAIGYILSGVG